MTSPGTSSIRAAGQGAPGFARLPDRGDLVGYPSKPIVRRDGAYTWHRADLSEAHALAAIADGSLRITTPSGETLDFAYERHEEHPSGDWTWIGRLEHGSAADEVVLTFGDKAAFGTIAQPGKEPLRVTIRDGASWLIETDAARIVDIRNRATQPKGPDYLVPPSSVSSREADAAASGPTMASAPSTAAATSSSTPVVDLVLGYTPGFAAMYGGQSQAVTRLNNMVAITNEAYANSQISGRVRLVHTLQVGYADNTDNGDVLEKLSGYKSGTGWVATDPAFSALRAAREQYGADLVSLVRRFNDPENDGCGIAWMIGGGGSRVDTGDEPFGYSVVSDGQDAGTDGKTYFCREETLAHEIGHNLGSQHDKATATEDGKVKQGAYPYSFGYKTDAANGNFYTVMAYGDSGQTRYRAFSNPRITFCGGRVCGVTDQADNARSHEQTMPVIAGFRAERVNLTSREIGAVRARDINLDGRDDLVWQNPVSNEHGYWLMGGGSYIGMRFFSATPKYQIVATADFNGDGRMDELWSGEARDLWMLIGDGSGFVDYYVDTHSAGWKIIGTGDVNGDRRADVIWQNFQTNQHGYWLMDGPRHVGMRFFPATPGYRIIATGDFNGDRLLDQLWSGEARDLWMLLGNGTGFKDYYVATHSAGWKIVSAGDVNRDGRDDVIWHNSGTREHGYWLMDGPRHFDMRFFPAIPGGWIAATGDFNGDGWLDELWTNSARDLWMLAGSAGNFSTALIHTHSEHWSITGTRTNW